MTKLTNDYLLIDHIFTDYQTCCTCTVLTVAPQQLLHVLVT